MATGSHTQIEALDSAELTHFQLEILYRLAKTGPSKGTALKSELFQLYESEINHGRLYPNLDQLAVKGYVNKESRDKRTNDYSLTVAGEAVVRADSAYRADIPIDDKPA